MTILIAKMIKKIVDRNNKLIKNDFFYHYKSK